MKNQSGAIATLLIAGLFLLVTSSSAFAQARSIEEFLQHKENWDDFVLTDYVWSLEGRYAIVSGNTMTFPHCPLTFLMTPELAENRGTTGVVEIKGKIEKDNGKLVFRVQTLISRPRDTDRLRTMRFTIDSTRPEDWYKVADWGHARAKFYNDKELEKDAIDLDRNGILTEFRRINPGDESGLATLVAKARSKNVGDDLVQRIQHESLRASYLNMKREPFSSAKYENLIASIYEKLPGSQAALKTWPKELAEKYQQNPLQIYAEATAETRPTLNRLFAVSVILERIQGDADPEGKNGFETAEKLASQVPEQLQLAQKFKDLELNYRTQMVPTMTRGQLDAFCKQLEKEGTAELIIETKKKWLQAREPSYRQEGARGLADLGEQWLALLKDTETARQFYLEAWRVNPQYTPAKDWLMLYGMKLVDGRWIRESELAAMPLSPLDQAVKDGRVTVGMTRRQVVSALGGPPTQMTRIATTHGVIEWWEYSKAGVVLQFARPRRGAESVVTTLNSISEPEPEPAPEEEKPEQ
ncbi:hypothetical protein [Planctomicrobium sp. SH527]|uniref:hypothetical protein n=1 Tax=Planctomicrobium sp. SH527 TaxID=3448123 RepID=UPI003F5BB3DD